MTGLTGTLMPVELAESHSCSRYSMGLLEFEMPVDHTVTVTTRPSIERNHARYDANVVAH